MASWPFNKIHLANDQLHWGLVFLEKRREIKTASAALTSDSPLAETTPWQTNKLDHHRWPNQ